jgi:hypothetical protein
MRAMRRGARPSRARSPSALERAETLWHAGRPNAKKAPRPARPTRYDRVAARDGGRIAVGAPRVRAPLQAKAIRDSWRTGRDARARVESAQHPTLQATVLTGQKHPPRPRVKLPQWLRPSSAL